MRVVSIPEQATLPAKLPPAVAQKALGVNSKLSNSTPSLVATVKGKLSEDLELIFHPNAPPHMACHQHIQATHYNDPTFGRQTSTPLHVKRTGVDVKKLVKSATTGSMHCGGSATRNLFSMAYDIVSPLSVQQYKTFVANADHQPKTLTPKWLRHRVLFSRGNERKYYKRLLSGKNVRWWFKAVKPKRIIERATRENLKLMALNKQLFHNKLTTMFSNQLGGTRKDSLLKSPQKRFFGLNGKSYFRQNSYDEALIADSNAKCHSLDNIFLATQRQQQKLSKQTGILASTGKRALTLSRRSSPVQSQMNPLLGKSTKWLSPFHDARMKNYGGSFGNIQEVLKRGAFEQQLHPHHMYSNTIIGLESLRPRLMGIGRNSPRSVIDPEFYAEYQEDEFNGLPPIDDGFGDLSVSRDCEEFDDVGETDEDSTKPELHSDSIRSSDENEYPRTDLYVPRSAVSHSYEDERNRLIGGFQSTSSSSAEQVKKLNRRKKSKRDMMCKSLSNFNKMQLLPSRRKSTTDQYVCNSGNETVVGSAFGQRNLLHKKSDIGYRMGTIQQQWATASSKCMRPLPPLIGRDSSLDESSGRQSSGKAIIKNRNRKLKATIREILNEDLNFFERESRLDVLAKSQGRSRGGGHRRNASNTVSNSRTASPHSTHSPQFMTRSNTPTNFHSQSSPCNPMWLPPANGVSMLTGPHPIRPQQPPLSPSVAMGALNKQWAQKATAPTSGFRIWSNQQADAFANGGVSAGGGGCFYEIMSPSWQKQSVRI